MILIKPSYRILTNLSDENVLKIYKNLEYIGRKAWKSEEKITDESYKAFIPMIMSKNHESVIEHEHITIEFVVDRGVSHELVRHRLASFTQESTRYCNYSKDKFSNNVTFIIPEWLNFSEGEYGTIGEPIIKINAEQDTEWINGMYDAEFRYLCMLTNKWTPQQARSVLPNSLKTEIVVTANMRQWRHIFHLRTSSAAHPQMREVMVPLLNDLKERLPLLFRDI